MTGFRKFKENGTPTLKYEPHDTGRAERQKVKPQISGFPQQELASSCCGKDILKS